MTDRTQMIRFVSALLAALVLTLLGPSATFAAEYNEMGTNCWAGTSNVVVRAKGDVAMNYVMHGTSIKDNSNSPLHNVSFRCVGAGTIVKGKFDGTTYCQAVAKNKDKAFAKCVPGKCTFTGGTGKLAGISGGSTSTPLGPFPSPAKGHFVNCSRNQYKYTIPE